MWFSIWHDVQHAASFPRCNCQGDPSCFLGLIVSELDCRFVRILFWSENFQVFISRNHFRGWVAFSVGSGEENSLDWRLFFNLKFRMLAVSYLSTLITQAIIEAGARTNGGRSAPCVRTWWLVRVCPDQWSPWEPVNRHGIASDNTNAKPR